IAREGVAGVSNRLLAAAEVKVAGELAPNRRIFCEGRGEQRSSWVRLVRPRIARQGRAWVRLAGLERATEARRLGSFCRIERSAGSRQRRARFRRIFCEEHEESGERTQAPPDATLALRNGDPER